MEGELERVLRSLEEKLYAGLYIYAAMAYLVWLPVLSVFLVLIEVLGRLGLLEGVVAMVFPVAYWVGSWAVIGYAIRSWRGYLVRLRAYTGSGGDRGRLAFIAWGFVIALIYLYAVMFSLLGFEGEGVYAAGLLLALATGISFNAVAEWSMGERRPVSLVPATVLASSAPVALYWGWGIVVVSVVAGYSTAAILYLYRALKRIA